MALQEQVVPIIFAQGLETKVDPKQIDAGKLLDLQNGVFTNPKEITKRNGYLTLSNSVFPAAFAVIPTTVTAGNSLGLINNNLVLADSLSLFSYLEDTQSWYFAGYNPNTKISTNTVVGSAASGFYPASLSVGTFRMTIAGTIKSPDQYQVVLTDVLSKNPLFSQIYQIAAAPIEAVQITAGAGNTFIYSTQINSGFLQVNAFNPFTSTKSFLFQIGSVGLTGHRLTSDASFFYLAYVQGTQIHVAKYDISTFALITDVVIDTLSSSNILMDMICDSVNSELIMMYSVPNEGKVKRFSLNIVFIADVYDTGVLTATTIGQITGVINQTAFVVSYNTFSGNDSTNFFPTTVLLGSYRTSPTILSASFLGYGTRIYSNPVLLNGVVYLATISMLPTQNNQYLIAYAPSNPDPSDPTNVLTATVAGKFAYEIGYFDPLNQNLSGIVGIVQWNGLELPFLAAESIYPLNFSVMANYGVSTLNLSADQKLTNVTLGNNINYVGGITNIYDGNGVAESGFSLFPVIKSVTPSSGTMTFTYTALYTWTDFQGNTHRSAPALPFTIDSAADISSGNVITVKVTGLGLTSAYKAPNVIIEIYRTANLAGSGGGTTYYLAGTVPNATNGTVTFVDDVPSTTIISNKQLYTTGGEVENISPPATNLMTSFKNRIILVDAENPLQWWFSKQIIQGFPAEFSDVLTQNIDQKGGPITALSTMDDKLIFFKTSNIWYIIGDGPSPNGQNNDFTYPQIISSDTGCVNQSSIVLSPNGLFFQSPKGIYLLGRDLSLNYIGAPVERYNSSTVTSAQMIAGTNQIRFSLDSGIVLVYDYFIQQWSTFTNIAANDAIIYKGNYTYLTLTGAVNTETPHAYVDPMNTPIALSLTTGWLSLAGLQGFERVKQFLILGESESPTTLSVQLAYNFESAITQTDNIPVTKAKIPMQYRVFMARQKCQSIQITLSDSPTTPTEGLRLSALALNIAAKKGPYKKPAAVTYG